MTGEEDDTRLCAELPCCRTEVTRLTIQVPANTPYHQTGVLGRYACATLATAATREICSATSHSTSTRAPAGLDCPVTRANWPSAQSSEYASCQTTSAASPIAAAGTRPRCRSLARTPTATEVATPRTRFIRVSAVGGNPSRAAAT